MKLLFDENLSPRLVAELSFLWPGSTHVETIGLRGATDVAIWDYARANDFAIVSKDDDFRSLALVRGAPPKVIWLQVGNASTSAIATLLRNHALTVAGFAAEPLESLLALSE